VARPLRFVTSTGRDRGGMPRAVIRLSTLHPGLASARRLGRVRVFVAFLCGTVWVDTTPAEPPRKRKVLRRAPAIGPDSIITAAETISPRQVEAGARLVSAFTSSFSSTKHACAKVPPASVKIPGSVIHSISHDDTHFAGQTIFSLTVHAENGLLRV
jgi:hypothetical protein